MTHNNSRAAIANDRLVLQVGFVKACGWSMMPYQTMQTSGLLLTIRSDVTENALSVARRLRTRGELTVGEIVDRWLPVAMEARDDAHAREIHDWIGALPEIEHLDVISVNFEDWGDPDTPGGRVSLGALGEHASRDRSND